MDKLRLVPDFYCTPVIATLHAAAIEGREKGICSRHILTVLEHRRILDDVIGYSHNQYIKEEILIPLALKNTYFSITEVDLDKVMSGYYVGYEEDFKAREYGMLATAEDVGIFLRALNNGSVFDQGEKEIYPYEYNHGGLVVGYQSLAEYHKDIDAVVVQFNNTTDFNGYEWNLGEISISRIIKIIQKKKSNE